MSEPITSGMAVGVGFKAVGGPILVTAMAAFISMLVTMCVSPPESRREWFVAITSTVISSICGGSYLVMKLGLQHWAHDYFGLAALFGLVFACGLPGWSFVRWVFNSLRAKEDMMIEDIIKEVKEV